MKKFITRVIVSFLFCFTLLLSNVTYGYAAMSDIPLNAVAANDNSTIETTYGPSIRSTSVPSTYIDLSYGTELAFNVTSLTYGNLFTNYGFKNVTAVQVDVSAISVDMNGSSDSVENLTIILHKKGSTADLATIDVSTSGGTVYFYNLTTSTNYYLEFAKRNDGQIFSFSGKIFDASDLFD